MPSRFTSLVSKLSRKKHKKTLNENSRLLGEIKNKISTNTFHMEHKLFHELRNKKRISFMNKILITILCVVLAIAGIILPIIPGLVFLIIPLVLFLPARKIKHIIKLRKSFLYMLANIRNTKIVKYKLKDIWSTLKLLFFEKKKKYSIKNIITKSKHSL